MINIYDFDGTIYDGDSTVDFYFFCLRKKPIILMYVPIILLYFVLPVFKIVSKTKMKEKFYLFLNRMSDIDSLIDEFWKDKYKNIKAYYLKKKHNNDVIISASPFFLLNPVCKKLSVKKLIASNVDKKTGKYDGLNCSGEEKVRRFNKVYKNVIVNEVYSDRFCDMPIFKLGKKAFLVKKNNISLIDVNKDYKEKKKNIIRYVLEGLFAISFVFLPLLFVDKYDYVVINFLMFISFLTAVGVIILLDKSVYDSFSVKHYVISLFISFYSVYILKTYSLYGFIHLSNFFNKVFRLVVNPIGCKYIIYICSIYSLSFIIYYFITLLSRGIKEEILSLDKTEKRFLIILCLVGFISFLIVYNKTNIMYNPCFLNKVCSNYDVLYTTDSGALITDNNYINVSGTENDIRQSLFGIFSLPFSLISVFISKLLFFIPNSFLVVFSTVQLLLLGFSIVWIGRMLDIGKSRTLFYIFCCCTYTMILFPFVYEQYIIALFYLILAIYIAYYNKMETNYFYCGAVGTLITSGVIFPLITKTKKTFDWFVNVGKCFLVYCFLMVMSSRAIHLFYFGLFLKDLLRFTGKGILFKDRLLQFVYFVRSIFIAPSTKIVFHKGVLCYWLNDVKYISILGIIIILLCIVSFIINRKHKFALISFLWIVFSFIILCLVGWGTRENGLILYSLYFFWAYCSLLFLLFNKIKNTKVKYLLFMLIIVTMICINIDGFLDIMRFGIRYYGVKKIM